MKRREIKEGKAIRQKLPGWLRHEKHFVGGKTVLGKIIVDQAKADTVREIFRLVLAGWGSRRIAKEFNTKDVPTVSGQSARWNGYSLLACIIRNPAVIGHYRVIENKKPTGEIIKGIFPAIVDEKTFYAANAAATGHRKQTTPAAALASNIATGLVRCPTCGGNMSRHRSHKEDGSVYSYLICASTKAGQNKQDCKCRPRYDAFESSLLALMADSATLRGALGQPVGEPSEITAMRGKLDAADRKLNELMALLEATPSKVLTARVQQLEAEAESMRAELQAKEATAKFVTPPAVAYDKFASELAKHVKEPGYRQRVKVALRSIIDHIQFHDRNTYTVHFKGGKPVEVWMSENGFKWETAKRVGKLAVP